MGNGCLTEARSHGALVFWVFFMFSSGGHLVQQSRMVRAILVEDNPRNILVKLLKNLSSSVRGGLLKQKLHCMYVNIYGKSASLMAFEGLMNRGTNG